jgi:hypothetical protein
MIRHLAIRYVFVVAFCIRCLSRRSVDIFSYTTIYIIIRLGYHVHGAMDKRPLLVHITHLGLSMAVGVSGCTLCLFKSTAIRIHRSREMIQVDTM